jgi:universal stress protein A
MTAYRRILAAVDLTEDSRAVAGRAVEIARATQASVQLLHVVEFMPIEPMNDVVVPMVQLDEQLLSRAREQIDALAAQLGIASQNCAVEAGNAKTSILRYAREQGIDLVVLGGRERHGLSILVNRTEDTVLHGAPCDVLAVRVR